MAVGFSADEPGPARFTRSAFILGSVGFAASVAGIHRGWLLGPASAATASESCGWVSWEMEHGLARDAFSSKDAELRADGYRLVRVSGYGNGNEPLLTGIWEFRPTADHIVELALPRGNFKDRNRRHQRNGYRLLAVDGFSLNGGADRYNGIWERSPGSPRFELGIKAQPFRDKMALGDGYRLVDVSGFELNGSPRFAGLWRKDGPTSAIADIEMSETDFNSRVGALENEGLLPVDVSAYQVAGATRYAAIWTKFSAAIGVHTLLDSASLDLERDARRYRGQRPVMVDAYPRDRQAAYQTVWRRDGITDADEDKLVAAVEDYRSQYDIPGLSLAFAKDGRLVYARAFGFADPPPNPDTSDAGYYTKPVTVHSRFRIASVSKPITATAIMRLVEDERFALDDKVLGPFLDREKRPPLLGTRYGSTVDWDSDEAAWLRAVTVQHLLEHTAGWPNDWTPNPMNVASSLDREGLVEHVINNSIDGRTFALEYPPGYVYGYSGFGYLLLTQIIEVVSGMSYEDYVTSYVIEDVDSTLEMALQTGSHENEVSYYGNEGSIESWLVWRRAGGGGWVGSAIDLVRFMTRVDRQDTRTDAISPDSIDRMIQRTTASMEDDDDNDYAKGWILDPESAIGSSLGVDYWHGGSLPDVRSVIARKKVDESVYCWAACVNTNRDPQWEMRKWFDLMQGGAGWPCLDLF